MWKYAPAERHGCGLRDRMRRWNLGAWAVFLLLYLVVTLASLSTASYAFDGLIGSPLFWIFALTGAAAVVAVPILNARRSYGWMFLGTSAIVVAVVGLAAVGLFPRLLPCRLDPAHSLDIYNAASTPLTRTVMLVIASIGIPLVIAYTIYVYRVFKGRVVLTEESY